MLKDNVYIFFWIIFLVESTYWQNIVDYDQYNFFIWTMDDFLVRIYWSVQKIVFWTLYNLKLIIRTRLIIQIIFLFVFACWLTFLVKFKWFGAKHKSWMRVIQDDLALAWCTMWINSEESWLMLRGVAEAYLNTQIIWQHPVSVAPCCGHWHDLFLSLGHNI